MSDEPISNPEAMRELRNAPGKLESDSDNCEHDSMSDLYELDFMGPVLEYISQLFKPPEIQVPKTFSAPWEYPTNRYNSFKFESSFAESEFEPEFADEDIDPTPSDDQNDPPKYVR